MRYQNPVYRGYFADPFVWKHQGKYYAVGTGPVSDKVLAAEGDFTTCQIRGKEMAIPLLVSDNLVNWRMHGAALEVPEEAKGAIFWAPEVAFDGRHFYLYFSFATKGLNHTLSVAVSDDPAGPYKFVGTLLPPTDECPFAIDAHAFQDDDGKWYLFYARDFLDFEHPNRAGTALVVDELINMTRLAGKQRTVLRAKCEWQRFQANREMYGGIYDWHTLEGPCVRKRGGIYYCFYSGGCYQGEGYGVDFGTSNSIWGPYSDEGNESGARVLRTVPGKVIGPGHHSIVMAPDNLTEFIVYHAWDSKMSGRFMCIDPLHWTAQGPRCDGPSSELRELKLGE